MNAAQKLIQREMRSTYYASYAEVKRAWRWASPQQRETLKKMYPAYCAKIQHEAKG